MIPQQIVIDLTGVTTDQPHFQLTKEQEDEAEKMRQQVADVAMRDSYRHAAHEAAKCATEIIEKEVKSEEALEEALRFAAKHAAMEAAEEGIQEAIARQRSAEAQQEAETTYWRREGRENAKIAAEVAHVRNMSNEALESALEAAQRRIEEERHRVEEEDQEYEDRCQAEYEHARQASLERELFENSLEE